MYESGRITRSAEYNITLDEILNVISKNVVYSIDYVYNEKGMLCKKTISDNGSEIVCYTEYPENSNPVTKVEVNGRNVESHSKTDTFGRKVFDETRFGTGVVSRQFSYHDGKVTQEHKENCKVKSSPTTSLVSGIVLSNRTTLSYDYDAEEHITSVTETYEVDGETVVKVTEYTYNALGQLESETSNGITTKFEYDNYGNIKAKGVADENGDIIPETKIRYAYDEIWEDMLVAYNGMSISYDAQGNPTKYLGHNLTWEKGRQLKSFGTNTYTYNANGIRTSKTACCHERHEYVLEGSKILKETWYGNSLIPIYDSSDSVCGISFNGISYFFLKNLQGDIIAVTNIDGETVVKYSYNAWGKCKVEFDTTGYIGNINPFRYRGYYFDRETGLYYLNSRYYDPKTGRFINADSPEYVSIQGGNLFAYCGNCPTKNADYFGFCYTPTYPETSVPSSPTYSYKKKKKEGFDRDWLALGIDIVATLLMPYAVAPYDVIGNGLAWLAKKAGFSLVWNKLLTGVVPKVISIFSKFFTLIRTIIWRVTGSLISNTVYLMISKLNGLLLETANNETIKALWIVVSMFFSFGSMIAGVLDLADGDFDGRISIFG